ncbi:MAG: DNA-binding response OmpR family regulator [Gammaproteobacteria bacterium]|jgi:DNA-binding response OmpR family regulator
MNKKPRILIVEDEIAIRQGLVDVFVFHGFEVDAVGNGNDGETRGLSGDYDLILLDVMLPGKNGFDICQAIREKDRSQPIIMLTAKSSDEDIIQGLSLGADDYVAKPFSVTQLVLRVQAVLRRSGFDEREEGLIRLRNSLVIDTRNLSTESNEVVFTRREMDLLQYLNQHNSRAVPRDELLSRVWGYKNHMDIETRTIDIHIAKLRRKVEADPANPEVILTVRGAGYRLMVSGNDA